MVTKTKNKKPVQPPKDKSPERVTVNPLLANAEPQKIKTDEIEFSPLNYRKYFSEDALQQFAGELLQHGIISALTVRKISSNKFELVAGERRLRAARIAGLLVVPAIVAELTDEQVIEIQLSENLQREDPHPFHEAQAIGQMQKTGKTIDEIAIRLGRSNKFIYSRLKLLALIDSFQEMLLADRISLQDAFEIAALSPASQTEFYNDRCSKWKNDEDFQIYNLDHFLDDYRYDLKKAPFNTKDKKLVAEAGACATCPSNSATLKTLFPEYSKTAICSNKECYNTKCTFHFLAVLIDLINTNKPTAFLYYNHLSEMGENIIAMLPEYENLSKHNANEVTVIEKPVCPEKEEFLDEDEELDEIEYGQAMDDYYSELEKYNLHFQSGHYHYGILIGNKTFEAVYFNLEKPNHYGFEKPKASSKDVQAAIKNNKATPELLEGEIERIRDKEKRAKEIDKEKVQLIVHKQLSEFSSEPENNELLTKADLVAARLIIYQSLDYNSRKIVNNVLFQGNETIHSETPEEVYEIMKDLSDQRFAYLIRMALCSKTESKYPTHEAGYFLNRVAFEAGIPVEKIEEDQNKKAKERSVKQEQKIKDLEKKLKKFSKVKE